MKRATGKKIFHIGTVKKILKNRHMSEKKSTPSQHQYKNNVK